MISHGPPGAGASFFTLCARSFEPGDSIPAVSYTHLDVYKRQQRDQHLFQKALAVDVAAGLREARLRALLGPEEKVVHVEDRVPCSLHFSSKANEASLLCKVAFTAYRMPDKGHASTSSIVSVSFSMR